MTDCVFVYMTAGSEEEAVAIGQNLVDARLAACVNVLPNMRSIYRWQGAITESQETVLIAKTKADLFEDLELRVKSLHSYSCPCIVALPLAAGSVEFLEWIDQMTMFNG